MANTTKTRGGAVIVKVAKEGEGEYKTNTQSSTSQTKALETVEIPTSYM